MTTVNGCVPSSSAIKMLEPVLEWLEAGAPHKKTQMGLIGFNMIQFHGIGYDDFEDQPCGTACCIAGAVCAFNPDSDIEIHISGVAEKLGLTNMEADALFYATIETEDEDGDPVGESMIEGLSLDEITPAAAAVTLRRFMQTGEITWELDHKERSAV